VKESVSSDNSAFCSAAREQRQCTVVAISAGRIAGHETPVLITLSNAFRWEVIR
jgi:hypothetical protein